MKEFGGFSLGQLLLTVVAVLGNALMLVIAFAVALKPFIGEMEDSLTLKQVHEASILLWFGPAVLAILWFACCTIFQYYWEFNCSTYSF